MRIAFVTTDLESIKKVDADGDLDRPLHERSFAAAGISLEYRVWHDPAVAWESYDLVVLRSPWDYIERLENCKVIVRPGVGYDNIDFIAARDRGIPVCNVPDYGTEEVADSVLGMALVLARGSHLLNSRLRRGIGDWNADQAEPIPRLRGRVFGVVGCGRQGPPLRVTREVSEKFFDAVGGTGDERSLSGDR